MVSPYLFISHDLSVVRSLCNVVAVMYLGKIVEMGETEDIFSDPLHPYTMALLSATPLSDPLKARSKKRRIIKGDVPSAVNPPTGCRFKTRCSFQGAGLRRGGTSPAGILQWSLGSMPSKWGDCIEHGSCPFAGSKEQSVYRGGLVVNHEVEQEAL